MAGRPAATGSSAPLLAGSAEPGDPELGSRRVAAAIDWRSLADDASGRQAIIRQVLTAVGIPGGAGAGTPRVA